MNISRSRYHRVDDPCVFVHTNVHLPSEEPTISFFRRVHLRSRFLSAFFSELSASIKEPLTIVPLLKSMPLLLEQIKDFFVQTVFLKEMAETQNRSLIGTF